MPSEYRLFFSIPIPRLVTDEARSPWLVSLSRLRFAEKPTGRFMIRSRRGEAPPGGRPVSLIATGNIVTLFRNAFLVTQKSTNRVPSGLPPGFGTAKERIFAKAPRHHLQKSLNGAALSCV
jgi:hypothetical protein